MKNPLRNAVYGFTVGDALGVPYEFNPRGTFECTKMMGRGTHYQPAGTWSDDTSMLLATCDSIREFGEVNPDDIMKRFVGWLTQKRYTCNGDVFDVGITTSNAINNYRRNGNWKTCGMSGMYDNGNGSLMRILPLAFVSCNNDDIAAVSALTHAHQISIDSCVTYVGIIRSLYVSHTIDETIAGKIRTKQEAEIKSSGFVLDTLEAAIWSFMTTENYRDCVLRAVNLGGDTDTIAAIAGGMAGVVYGLEGIPEDWINGLRNKELIEDCLFE